MEYTAGSGRHSPQPQGPGPGDPLTLTHAHACVMIMFWGMRNKAFMRTLLSRMTFPATRRKEPLLELGPSW